MVTHKGTKTIITERLILRKFQVDDATNMFNNWASDENVTRFLTWKPHESVDATKQLLEGWVAAYNNEKTYNWVIEYKGQAIGSISVVRLSDKCEYAELGYCLGYNFWNYKGRRHHGLAYYYLIDFCDGNDIPETEEFISQKDDPNVVLGWMPIDKLKDITIYPTFLKDEIYNLNGELKHFVSKE